MLAQVYVAKIVQSKTSKENVYKVSLKSQDDKIKVQVKIDAEDWDDFQSEHGIDVNTILFIELKKLQTKITEYSGEDQ